MRKLTALTVALSLSAAGQAFAGEPHAPAAHTPAAHAPATPSPKGYSRQSLMPISSLSQKAASTFRPIGAAAVPGSTYASADHSALVSGASKGQAQAGTMKEAAGSLSTSSQTIPPPGELGGEQHQH